MPFLAIFESGSTLAIIAGAFALGLRHGIDWDHIAAIADITSGAGTRETEREAWLAREPGLQLTDETHHRAVLTPATAIAGGGSGFGSTSLGDASRPARRLPSILSAQGWPAVLAGMYALGHGSMVIVLGLIAILFSRFLPSWIDPIMERIVGVTLVLLAVYLFYSLYRFFRTGGEFRLRSRWMLIFSGASGLWHRLRHRLSPHAHDHHVNAADQQYGPRTAFGIGLIHGIGAETGTQVLVIGTAVGAASKSMGVVTLFVFVLGLLVSNAFVTVLSTAGFVTAGRRQVVYGVVGIVAAVFSLLLGIMFLAQSAGDLPSLDPYFRWIGGPD